MKAPPTLMTVIVIVEMMELRNQRGRKGILMDMNTIIEIHMARRLRKAKVERGVLMRTRSSRKSRAVGLKRRAEGSAWWKQETKLWPYDIHDNG